MNVKVKKGLKVFGLVLIALILILTGYIAYLFIDYDRVEDNLKLDVLGDAKLDTVQVGEEYEIVSFNIGFGAYEPDYGFFMDGGTESRAFSEERLLANLSDIESFIEDRDADIYLLQEVDEDGTRTYHVNERARFEKLLTGYASVWAQNWDSSYLFYPVTQPHGKNLAGMMTFSRFDVNSALRRSLPIEDTLMKIVDIDRCYSVSRIAVANGKELVVYNAHLSAYTSDGKIAEDQIKLLAADMSAEYENGNYVICGGDFNKDLHGNAEEIFGVSGEEYTWAQPFPTSLIEKLPISLVVPYDESKPVPSCRNADGPYNESQFVLTVDGFIVSDNVEVVKSNVIDVGFEYSDHNPVYMNFKLLEK